MSHDFSPQEQTPAPLKALREHERLHARVSVVETGLSEVRVQLMRGLEKVDAISGQLIALQAQTSTAIGEQIRIRDTLSKMFGQGWLLAFGVIGTLIAALAGLAMQYLHNPH